MTLPLELFLGARVYRRPRRLLASLFPVVGVFLVWDLVAIHRGHWWFNADFVTGIELAGVPIEELCFFFVVPICALLTYEAVTAMWAKKGKA